MAIKLYHFDTKTKQNTGIQEKLENTLAEYLFGGVEFSIGTAYPQATVKEDLQKHHGMTLQFSAGKRMYFASDPTIREQLYPNPSDGAAYPLPFTPCRSFHELRYVRILVIDDVTGNSGGILATDDAKQLVGDCKGLIDKDFAKANNIEPRTFQFRLGIRPQQQSPVMRIAKGTLAPARLDQLGASLLRMSGRVSHGTLSTKTGYDMVLATSSFKGRKAEDAIQPGEYVLSIGLGVKALACYREHSLGTQILVNYPKAVKQEILPMIKQQAEKLAHDQKDLRRLAQRYVDTYERRQRFLAKSIEVESEYDNQIEDEFSIFDNLDSGKEEDSQNGEDVAQSHKDLLLYSLLKADLNSYCQLLEHPKIVTELQEFVRKQWVEIATGRSIKFTSGLAQPSLNLQSDEICIPSLEANEEIIVTRSPLINSNGVITLKNKHLPLMLDGCVYIHPKTAMDNLQCDFDGDLLAFAASKDFPQLASEVKEKTSPENRYPNIIKKAKIPYRGSFEEIAISAMENQMGIIANEIQKNLALQCELCAMPQIEKSDYLKQASIHLSKVLQGYQQGKLKIPEQIVYHIQQITTANINALNPTEVEQKFNLFKKVLKDCVAELGNELQVAADGPKSALRPDKSIIKYCQAITAYKEVAWLSDKKNIEAFTNRGMKSNGYSPIDLMIQQTNQIFEQNQIIARPIEQFRNLYPEIEFNQQHQEKAQEIKSNYNSLIKQRLELESRNKFESGPYMVITSPTSGRQLEITNLIEFAPAKNPIFWTVDKLTIRIQERTPSKIMPHLLKATVKSKNADDQEIDITIGTVSLKSMQEHDLKPGMSIKQGKIEFHFGITDGMVDALKQQAKEYIESIINITPDNEKLQLAAAIHDVSHTESSQNYSGLKRAGVAFAIFSNEVIGQLQQLQFTQMRVIGTQFNEYAFQNFQGERVPIKFEHSVHPRDPTKTARWVILEGKKLGILDARSPHLLAGCEAIAAITSAPSTSFIVSSLKNPDHQLQIDSVNQYAFATRQWLGEQVNITLDVRQTQERKAPTVVAYLDNQILGVVNKQSVNFLQGRLAAVGRQIHGFSFVGMLNNAPASYVDIVIDSSSVKFPEITVGEHENNSAVATVVFFSASVDSQLQAKTEQVLCNMLRRAVDRAVERGYDTIRFVDVSLHSDKSSQNLKTIEMLATERKNIKVEFKGAASLEDAIALLTQPDDIVLGIRSPKTIGIIDFASKHRKAIAAYIPETGRFERRNLPSIQKAIVAINYLECER